MPKEYIERRSARKQLQKEAAIAEYKGVIHHVVPVCAIDKIPAADVVEVKHGEWMDDRYVCRCSICHKWLEVPQGTAKMNYCPNCGAKMDGER